MPNSAPHFGGKTKIAIAHEAFRIIGPDATIQEVDAYFNEHYGLPHCERSMYSAARRKAQGRPVPTRRRYPRNKDLTQGQVTDIVNRTIRLAADAGGWDELKELIEILRKI